MEKYLKFSDVMEELDRLVRTKQIEPIHINLDQIEENFEKISIKSSIGFKGAIRVTQRLKNEYDNILEHGHKNVNKLYIEAMLDVLDEIEDEFKDLKEENNPLDLLVIPTFAEADIRRRYDRICNKIDYWRKRVEKEKSYEQGYEYGLVYAEKQFRNLFKDGEGNELDSESSV